MLRTSARRAAGTNDSNGGGRDPSHILAPSSNATNNGINLAPTNNCRLEYFEGDSRFLNNFARELTVWFELLGYMSNL
jgi:hypothetical protein